MISQDIVEEAVRLINEVEILRRAVVKIDGRCGDALYLAVERFKEAKTTQDYFLSQYSDDLSFDEALKECLRDYGVVIGGDLTPNEKRKFRNALDTTPRSPVSGKGVSEESKRFEGWLHV